MVIFFLLMGEKGVETSSLKFSIVLNLKLDHTAFLFLLFFFFLRSLSRRCEYPSFFGKIEFSVSFS